MNKKALLLIIPFAAAGLAGCERANPPAPAPQCDTATVSITSAGGVTAIKPGETLQLTAKTNIEGCSFSWDSTDKSVATVDSNGEVTAIKVGQTTIKYGPGEFKLTVDNNPPVPKKEVSEVLSVKDSPKSVVVGGTISASSVILNVKFTDGSSGEIAATKVECDTSTAGDTIVATAYYKDLEPVTFTIKVIAQGETTHAGTEADPYDSADAASVASSLAEGGVTQQSYYIKGTVEKFEETFSSQFGNYSFNIGNNFICWRLKNGSSKAKFNEGDIEIGDEVVVYAQIQKFHQDAKDDKPERTLLETKDGYVVSVKKGSAEKEVEALVSATGPSQVTVGTQIKPADVNISVRFTDQSTGNVKATNVVCDTSVVGDAIQGQAYYNDLGPVSFTVKVVAQSETTHAGTEADPYDSADAASVASALAEGGVTQQSYYIKGTVEKFEETFSSQFGNYSFNIGNNFICWRLKNGSSKASFNEGDIEIGDEVVVYAQIQKFHQDAKDDKPERTLLETKDGYVVSVSKGGEQKEITDITAVTYTKTLYVGGTINPADVTLTVTYSDGSPGTVKAQSVDGYSTASAGNTTATAHYGTFTKTFEVAVSEAPLDPVIGQTFTKVNTQSELSEGIYILGSGNYFFHGADEADKSIVVSGPGDSIVGLEGMAGLQIEEVGGGYSIKVLNGANAGKYIGPKSGNDKNIVFGSNPVTHTISVAEGVSTITSGEKLLKFNDQTGQNRFRYYTSGQKDVVLYKQGTPAPQKTITGVELQGTLTKSSYVAGQTFDPSGLSLKVTYDDQSEETVTSGFAFNVTNPLEVGEYDLKATYQEHESSNSVHISVVAKALTALEIKSGMTKIAYTPHDCWESNGIVVEGTYNDGSKATLAEGSYSLDFDPADPYLGCEEVSIVARAPHGIASASFVQTVTVTEEPIEATLTGIAASGYTNTATVGQTYTFDGTVTASYSDGSSHAVTGYTWTTPISTASAGEKTGVISYTEDDVTKTCNVVVTVSAPVPVESSMKEGYEAAAKLSSGSETSSAYTFSGVVTGKRTNNSSSVEYMIQDGDYAIDVFNPSNKTPFVVGNTVTITSTLQNFNGLIETKSISSVTAGGTAAAATPVNINSLVSLNALKTSVLVKGAGTVVSKPSYESTKDLTMKIQVGSDQISVFFKKNFIATFETFIKSLEAGDAITINNAVVGCYSGTNQFTVIDETTLAKGPAKEVVSLGQVTAPESIGKGGTLSVSDVSVAVTYDDTTTGSVHPDSIDLNTSAVSESVTGTVHVGDLSATFTIAVTEKPVSTETTITKAIKDISGTTSDGTKVSNMTMDAVISLVASDSGNNGKVYSSGAEWRLYHSDSGTMTVNAASGYTIMSVAVTYTIGNSGYLSYGGNKVNSGDVVMINGTSAIFVADGGQTGKTNGQVKVTSITVVYKAN